MDLPDHVANKEHQGLGNHWSSRHLVLIDGANRNINGGIAKPEN